MLELLCWPPFVEISFACPNPKEKSATDIKNGSISNYSFYILLFWIQLPMESQKIYHPIFGKAHYNINWIILERDGEFEKICPKAFFEYFFTELPIWIALNINAKLNMI